MSLPGCTPWSISAVAAICGKPLSGTCGGLPWTAGGLGCANWASLIETLHCNVFLFILLQGCEQPRRKSAYRRVTVNYRVVGGVGGLSRQHN